MDESLDASDFQSYIARPFVIHSAAMRWILFFPLTFVAGVHGFAIFAPYLFFIAMLAAVTRRRKSATPVAVPVKSEIHLREAENSRINGVQLPAAL